MTIIFGPTALAIKDTTHRVKIALLDDNNEPINAATLSLQVFNSSETLILQDDFFEGYGAAQTDPTQIVKPASTTGEYYFPFGDTSFDTANTTAESGEFLFHWTVTTASDSTPKSIVQVVNVISVRVMRWLPKLKLRVDKVCKDVDENAEDPIFLGYTDSMLIEFLSQGLGWINAMQPQVGWNSVDEFPDMHHAILLDAATIAALLSQEILAIDTDYQFCLVEGTQVTLADGTTKPIEDIQIGELVVDKTGNTQVVTAAWCEGVPDTVTELVMWGARKVTATTNHKWPVYAWTRECACGCGQGIRSGTVFVRGHHTRVPDVQVKKIRGGSWGGSLQRIPEGYEPLQKLETTDIRPKDFLLFPRKYEVVETDVTPDEARLLGYYAAEGNMVRTPSGEPSNLSFAFHKEEVGTWVKDIKSILAPYDIDLYQYPSPTSEGIHVATRNDYRRNKDAIRLAQLANYHVPGESLDKRLSDELMHWPLHLKLEFIKGLLRGDGHEGWSVAKGAEPGQTYRVFYSTSSPYLATQVEQLLMQLGFPCARGSNKAKKVRFKHAKKEYQGAPNYVLKVSNHWAIALGQLLWGETSIGYTPPNGPRGVLPRPECMMDDDFVYIPVKKVTTRENSEGLKVYNLTVNGDHSYIAGGVATYNSDQGHSFNIAHYPMISATLNAYWTRLTQVVPGFKRQYWSGGSVRVEQKPGGALQALLDAAPHGSTFRRWFTA